MWPLVVAWERVDAPSLSEVVLGEGERVDGIESASFNEAGTAGFSIKTFMETSIMYFEQGDSRVLGTYTWIVGIGFLREKKTVTSTFLYWLNRG